MYKAVVYINRMDCPAEEQIVRSALSDIKSVKKLTFDLADRKVSVYYEDGFPEIRKRIESLGLGCDIIENNATDEKPVPDNNADKKLLWSVLGINFSFFILEAISGYISGSIGLVADSLDMLADAAVYAMSLYAISGTIVIKKRIAGISGVFQLLLAFSGFIEVIRRFFGAEAVPDPAVMISVSALALIANGTSLILLSRSATKEAHMVSSRIFTSNDVIANAGVIAAGILVSLLDSKFPDLIIGFLVFLLVFRGAVRILKISR